MKYNLEIIQDELDKDNWKVISDIYKNLDEPMTFECNEGHRVYDSWRHIRNKRECPICLKNTYKEIEHKVTKKKTNKKRLIALDQSSRITGYSIYDGKELIDYGVFETQLEDEIQRAHQLKEWLISMCKTWRADYVAIEGIQYQQNFGVTTFQTLARVQGILMDTCLELGLPYEVCATNTWRHACGVKGSTRTDKKRSMQLLVKKWYDITVTDDAADAIGIGKYVAENILTIGEIIEWE